MVLDEPQKYNRRSMRLSGYDYTQPGAYFITLVTFRREHVFGEIVDGKMRLTALGEIARDEWMRSNQVRQEIHLHEDEFVLMPNHLHGIVWITAAEMNNNPPYAIGANGIRPMDGVGARRAPLPQRVPRSLGTFVGSFKSAVTSRARKDMNLSEVWQRNYYDHIIRNERDFENIWLYIDDNPRKWEDDRFFS